MAVIMERKRKKGSTAYAVKFRDRFSDNPQKQRWIGCESLAEAILVKAEIEAAATNGEAFCYEPNVEKSDRKARNNLTVADLLAAYVDEKSLGGWSPGTRDNSLGIIENYILPNFGDCLVADITAGDARNFYTQMRRAEGVGTHNAKNPVRTTLSDRHIEEMQKVLRPAFEKACADGIIKSNPFSLIKLPKLRSKKRAQWSGEEAAEALALCDDRELCLYMRLMLNGTLRTSEVSALTFGSISDLAEGGAKIYVDKNVRRVSKSSIEKTQNRGVLLTFPNERDDARTVLALKDSLKTEESGREVVISEQLALLLNEWKAVREKQRVEARDRYVDCGHFFVFAHPNGRPCTVETLSKRFEDFVRKKGLRKVDAYSLRATSITALLRKTRDPNAVAARAGTSPEIMWRHYYEIEAEDHARLTEAAKELFLTNPGQNDTS